MKIRRGLGKEGFKNKTKLRKSDRLCEKNPNILYTCMKLFKTSKKQTNMGLSLTISCMIFRQIF